MKMTVSAIRSTRGLNPSDALLYDFSVRIVGSRGDLIGLIDEGSLLPGHLGNLASLIAAETGLVDVPSDRHAQAARLLRQAAALLEA